MNKGLSEQEVWSTLKQVVDPELPFLPITDLGMVRKVNVENENIAITITPTYMGCPATDVIAQLIQEAFGSIEIEVLITYKPAWTTEWISEEGRALMLKNGIAPPHKSSSDKRSLLNKDAVVTCPFCSSQDTKLVSLFGSTACKAQYRCQNCKEPFDYFKCL